MYIILKGENTALVPKSSFWRKKLQRKVSRDAVHRPVDIIVYSHSLNFVEGAAQQLANKTTGPVDTHRAARTRTHHLSRVVGPDFLCDSSRAYRALLKSRCTRVVAEAVVPAWDKRAVNRSIHAHLCRQGQEHKERTEIKTTAGSNTLRGQQIHRLAC